MKNGRLIGEGHLHDEGKVYGLVPCIAYGGKLLLDVFPHIAYGVFSVYVTYVSKSLQMNHSFKAPMAVSSEQILTFLSCSSVHAFATSPSARF